MENTDSLLPASDRRRRIWPLLLIFLAIGLAFHSMLFLSKVPYLSDIKSYYYPVWSYFSHAFHTGGPSFWCPGIYCGFPLFADGEAGIFYPINLLLFQLPATAGFNYSIILHYLLGGFFTYAYCRRLRLSRAASLFSSIPFVLGGFFLAHMVHPNAVATAAWMPLFLYFLERALAERRKSFFIAVGGVFGLQFLSGFLMINLMEAVIAFFYVIFYPREEGEKSPKSIFAALGWLALALGLGLGLGTIQSLPSYNLVQSSYRAGGLSRQVSNMGNLPPAQWFGLFFPRAFGRGIAQGSYLGAWTFEETFSYIGILPLLFAPAALLKPRRWHATFFLWVGVASFFLSLGNIGLLWPVLRLLPGFNILKGPSRFILIFNLAALILGGMGFDRWRSGEFPARLRSSLTRFWAIVAAVAGGLLALSVILYRFNPLGFRDFAAAVTRPFLSGIKLAPSKVLDGLYSYFTSPNLEFLIPLVMLALFFLLIRNGGSRRRPSPLVVALAVILVVVDVLFMAISILQPVPRDKVEYKPQVVDVLEEYSSGGRVALLKEPGVNRGEYSLSSNQLLPYGLDDAFGFSTIPPQRLDRFLGLQNTEASPSAFELLGVRLLYANLVRIKGMPYDLSTPFTIPDGLGETRYACPADTTIREISLLIDGTILEPDDSGRVYFKLDSGMEGETRTHVVLMLEKETGSGEYLFEAINGEKPASFKTVNFKSPGYGQGRTALQINVPLGHSTDADEIIVTTVCDRSLEGTQLASLSVMGTGGRGIPLSPWPALFSNAGYSVYELPDELPRAFTAREVVWTKDWGEAVDLAWKEPRDAGEVILVEGEIDAATRAAIDAMRSPAQETKVTMEEESDGHLSLRASGTGDAILIVSLNYMPGWSATIDEAETPLFSAYGFLTALYLPAGEHEVKLSYKPPGVAPAIPISALSLLMLALLFVLFRKRERPAAGGDGKSTRQPPPTGGISAFFPCYNDSATLEDLVEKALEVLGDLTGEYEVIVIDDGSTDGSNAVIDSIAAKHRDVRVIRHDRNRGYGAALRSGIKTSTKEWVFYTDSDGQYDLEDLRLLHSLSGTADVINGYKSSRSDPWYRVFLGSVYNSVVRFFFDIPIRDVDCDFRLMRGDLVRGLDLRSNGGAICVEMVTGLRDAGATFAETPVSHRQREEGKSQFFNLKNMLVMVGELVALLRRRVAQVEVRHAD